MLLEAVGRRDARHCRLVVDSRLVGVELGRRDEASLVVLRDPHFERPERPAFADCLDRQLNSDFRGHRTQEVAVQ